MSASGIARFFPEKLFNFVQCVLCNLADIPPFLPRRHTKKLPRRRHAAHGKGSFCLIQFRVHLTEVVHRSITLRFPFFGSRNKLELCTCSSCGFCVFFQRIRFLLPEQRFFCIMAVMEGRCLLQIFNTPGILKLELSGQVILDFLLDHFVPAVLYYDSAYCTDGQAPSKADKKLLAIFSGNYKQDYQNTRTGTESFDLYLRLLMVTDYISGMTDSYARTLYRELSGIE